MLAVSYILIRFTAAGEGHLELACKVSDTGIPGYQASGPTQFWLVSISVTGVWRTA